MFDREDGSGGGGRRARNVLGGELQPCSHDPVTGYFRDGCCNTDAGDLGQHLVCARVDEAFLAFSLASGNDLVTPRPEYGFVGLKPGDQWCLCAGRWLEAQVAGVAPPVVLAATHASALDIIPLEVLQAAALEY